MVLKSALALNIQPFWWPKCQKTTGDAWRQHFGPPKPPFSIKDKQIIQNIINIWACIHADSQDFWRSFNITDKTKCVKNVVNKCQKKLTPFWGTSKNWRLNKKLWTDLSWLLVVKTLFKTLLQIIFGNYKPWWIFIYFQTQSMIFLISTKKGI